MDSRALVDRVDMLEGRFGPAGFRLVARFILNRVAAHRGAKGCHGIRRSTRADGMERRLGRRFTAHIADGVRVCLHRVDSGRSGGLFTDNAQRGGQKQLVGRRLRRSGRRGFGGRRPRGRAQVFGYEAADRGQDILDFAGTHRFRHDVPHPSQASP